MSTEPQAPKKYTTGPKPPPAQAAQTSQPPPPPPPADLLVAEPPKKSGWRPMDTAPKDGTYLFLKGDPTVGQEIANEWFWHATRQFRKGMWQSTGWWRRRFGPNAPPSFTPDGWRKVTEGFPK